MSTFDLVDGNHAADDTVGGMFVFREHELRSLAAAGIPVRPPKRWFDEPGLPELTPLTIKADGQVYGHIAAWHTSHIGMAGGIKPPRSRSNYAFFRTGAVETQEGDLVNVGQITLSGGHAPLEAAAASAVEHYDNTESAIMDVAAGEDRHGIWVAGALRPSVSDEQIRAIRASSVSGDWRPINGRLELVAVCAVNCPGFPIPRARVAGGAPVSLVAAGVTPLVEQALKAKTGLSVEDGIEQGLALFRERIVNIEALLAAAQMEQLRERVSPKDDQAAALRARVHGA